MTFHLSQRRVLLIISGGIAAYKSLDLIRRLKEEGAMVRCVLTKGGSEFVTPLSVAALSATAVYTDLWSLTDDHHMGHIRLSREADIILVVPATANLMAKMAQGIADDLASTLLLAGDKPVFVAPSMNVMMWHHPATQANVSLLQKRGVTFIGPVDGSMACGEEGVGRMVEVPEILNAVDSFFAMPGPLAGKRAIVTSGPTIEPLDPVRFIGNKSSGKQGHAIARALSHKGAETILITGPTSLVDPVGVRTIHIETAREMLAACEDSLPADIAVCAAAVADWRPFDVAEDKLKKGLTSPSLTLVENPDILATLAASGNRRPRLVIGFAAETTNVVAQAEEKLRRKKCDWLLANEVGPGKGFDQDENEITFLSQASGQTSTSLWPRQTKDLIAQQLVDEIVNDFGH